MTKELKGEQIRELGFMFQKVWEKEKKDVKLSPKTLYNVLKLKKEIDKHCASIEDAMVLILEQENCENQGNGRYNIPEEKRDIVGDKFDELADQILEIEYSPLVITDDDVLPTSIFEALFDFIEIK